MNRSIGIIGGADGPTAIFLASSGLDAVWLLGGILACAVIFVFLRRRRQK